MNQIHVFVKILQNGNPVADISRPIRKGDSFVLTSAPDGDLVIPYYPFVEEIELIEVSREKKVWLSINFPCSGVVLSEGTVDKIESFDHQQRTYLLENGDYATIQAKDLQIMVKVEPIKSETWVAIDPSYRGKFRRILFRDRYEVLGAYSGFFAALFFIGCLSAGLLLRHVDIPRTFYQLSEEYNIPFISPDNLETAPEALKEHLDRRQYVSLIIKYYRAVSAMLMGIDGASPENFLYPESITMFRTLFDSQQARIDFIAEKQEHALQAVKNTNYGSIVSIPAIYGESFQQKLLRMISRLDTLHQGFRLNLTLRRDISRTFREDPDYDWNDYTTVNKKRNEINPELSKIKVFHQLTNEQAMYADAKLLAARSEKIHRFHLTNSEGKPQLMDENVAPIFVSSDFKFASFFNSLPQDWDESKVLALRSSEFGAQKAAPVKEPLIGEIAPHLLDAAVNRNRFHLNLCYESALRHDHKLRGQMEWIWRVDSKGVTSDIELLGTTLKDRQMIDCVRKKIALWSFPGPKRGSVKVKHTFSFEPRNG